MDNNKKCPFIKGTCIKEKCIFWARMMGSNPQTSEKIDTSDCAIVWLPILLIENAKTIAQNQTAIEKFRNNTAQFQDMFIGAVRVAQETKDTKKED